MRIPAWYPTPAAWGPTKHLTGSGEGAGPERGWAVSSVSSVLGFDLLATPCDPPESSARGLPPLPQISRKSLFLGKSHFSGRRLHRGSSKGCQTLYSGTRGGPAHDKGPPQSWPAPPTPVKLRAGRGRTQGQQKKSTCYCWLQETRKGPGRPGNAACAWRSGDPRASESRRLGSISSIATDSACNYFWSFIYICLSPVPTLSAEDR